MHIIIEILKSNYNASKWDPYYLDLHFSQQVIPVSSFNDTATPEA